MNLIISNILVKPIHQTKSRSVSVALIHPKSIFPSNHLSLYPRGWERWLEEFKNPTFEVGRGLSIDKFICHGYLTLLTCESH